MLFNTHFKDLQNCNQFITLCKDDQEAYFMKIITNSHHVYRFKVMLSENLMYLTIEMQAHNLGEEHLEIYIEDYVNCFKPFNNVDQLLNFIDNFINY